MRGPAGAPPLLLLHGLGDSIPGWARAAGPLARRHRLHLLDLPGHGLSADPPDWSFATLARAVESYLETLARPVVVAHSLGAWIAARLLARRPQLASALVLVNPAGPRLAAHHWPAFQTLVSAGTPAEARRYLEATFHRAPLVLRLLPGEVVKAMRAPNLRGFLAAVREEDFLRDGELDGLPVPAQIVWGARDRLLPDGTLAWFRAALPRAQVTILDKAGHCPHLETPGALVRAIVDGEAARAALTAGLFKST